MSKYTTEVRYICESYAGYRESQDNSKVNEIVQLAYPKIFNTDILPTFNGEEPTHRALLYQKILLHYYTREIAFETVGLWKLKLNQKLLEILPYYNQLYESELIKYNPLENLSRTLDHAGNYTDNQKDDKNKDRTQVQDQYSRSTTDTNQDTILRHSMTTTKGNDTKDNKVNKKSDTWSLFSDTPQGGIDGVNNASSIDGLGGNAYLSNATHTIGAPEEQTITNTYGNTVEQFNADGDKADTTKSHTISDGEFHSTTKDLTTEINNIDKQGKDAYKNVEIGKHGTMTYSNMIKEWRSTFLNIDQMIIEELEPLFMQLW